MSEIHNTFHVSQLRKCAVVEMAVVPLEDIEVYVSLNYIKRPTTILDRKVKTLRSKEERLVKVQWEHRWGSKWTWEPESKMHDQ